MYSLNGRFKRALVTGGAGFVGSHIVEELLADGLEVVSVDDYSAGKAKNLQPFKENVKLTEVNCDITDRSKLGPFFDGVDIVFHEAVSKMTVCLKNPRRDLQINAEGTFNLLELSRDFGVKKFIHASTGSVYGEAKYYPTDEKHPVNPTSFYGVSKLAGEKYVRLFSEMFGIDTTILRYYHVYGPRQENSEVGGVVSIFAKLAMEGRPLTIFGDGTQLRSFTYVKDVVNVINWFLNKPKINGLFNVGSSIPQSFNYLAKCVYRNCNISENIEYIDTPKKIRKQYQYFTKASLNKLRKVGYNDKFFNLKDGINDYIQNYLIKL